MTLIERLRKVDWRAVGFHAARWGWVPALALLTRFTFPTGTTEVAPLLEPGAVASSAVVAPFAFVVPKSDSDLVREAEELARSAQPIYEFRERTFDSVATSMRAFFAALEPAARNGASGITQAAADEGIALAPGEAQYLVRPQRREAMSRALGTLLLQTLGQGTAAPGVIQREPATELIVRRRGAETTLRRDQVPSFSQYLARARALHPDRGSATGDAVWLKLAAHYFKATLFPNRTETERRRDELRRSIDPNKAIVRAGDRLVAAHEVVTSEQAERLGALHAELLRRGAATSQSFAGIVGPVLRDSLVLSIFWVLLLFYRRETYRDLRQVGLIGGLFAATIAGAALVARFQPAHPELIPLPFAAVMLTVLFNGRVSMIAALILSFVIAAQPALRDQPALFLSAVGGVTAALSVRALRRRSQLYGAVLVVGLGYLAAALALGLGSEWSLGEIGWRALFGVANGVVSASVALLVLPQLESFTGLTTDLTLLELSDPGHPLLRRLSLEAPGTYAHSIAMANLVEAACNRVGANGLLGRVGCYYHDVGKVSNPQYFVENQTRANPHDRLPAQQSAEIIKGHVTEGVRLAEEAGIPPVVAAFIPEHHGTAEITYFLDRARQQGDTPRPGAYRYPGPRPRSMETAIAMLADSVEAALRVLDELTPVKIAEAIDHIVRNRVAAGQLVEAPLTLAQLEEVKQEFVRVLSGMYHGRIDYPEYGGGISSDWQSSPARPSVGL